MSDITNKYGEFESEKIAAQNQFCRELATNISQLEISNRQRMFLIYLLSLELDDVNMMKSISQIIRDSADNFVIDRADAETGEK